MHVPGTAEQTSDDQNISTSSTNTCYSSTAFVLKSLVLMHQDHQAEIITWTVLVCNNLETGTHFSRKVKMMCSYFGYYNKDVLDNVVDEIKSNVHMDLNLT